MARFYSLFNGSSLFCSRARVCIKVDGWVETSLKSSYVNSTGKIGFLSRWHVVSQLDFIAMTSLLILSWSSTMSGWHVLSTRRKHKQYQRSFCPVVLKGSD